MWKMSHDKVMGGSWGLRTVTQAVAHGESTWGGQRGWHQEGLFSELFSLVHTHIVCACGEQI